MDNKNVRKKSFVHLGKFVIVLAAIAALITSFKISGFGANQPKKLVDFDIFYLVGAMVWEGSVADLYAFEMMAAAQKRFFGTLSFMPWSYPPPFNLVLAPFALFPISASYLLFILGSFGLYLLVLRRLAREHFASVLVITFPATAITISCGQNGFITGSLIGLCAILLLNRRIAAGIPLGLMIIKPHLAIGLSAYVFAKRWWSVVGTAALTVSLSILVSSLALGLEIWAAFLKGSQEVRSFMVEGFYPLYRMVSIYAMLHTGGATPAVALIIHVLIALVICSCLTLLVHRAKDASIRLGCSVLATLFISPYLYDYDLPVLGVAAALLCRGVLAHSTRAENCLMFALAWVSSGWGLFTETRLQAVHGWNVPVAEVGEPLSFAGAALTLLALVVMAVLRRSLAERTKPAF